MLQSCIFWSRAGKLWRGLGQANFPLQPHTREEEPSFSMPIGLNHQLGLIQGECALAWMLGQIPTVWQLADVSYLCSSQQFFSEGKSKNSGTWSIPCTAQDPIFHTSLESSSSFQASLIEGKLRRGWLMGWTIAPIGADGWIIFFF